MDRGGIGGEHAHAITVLQSDVRHGQRRAHGVIDLGRVAGRLRAFYTAQRAHLENKLLMGTRKERKSRMDGA